jgi:hypothetical protein
MIECICIDDSNKPKEIPARKWIKKDKKYHIIFTTTAMPQKILAVELSEICLDESCNPYEYFDAKRFGLTYENLIKLNELIKNCSDIDFSIDELMKQTELVEQ